jgi:hypothetical protein
MLLFVTTAFIMRKLNCAKFLDSNLGSSKIQLGDISKGVARHKNMQKKEIS